MLHLGAAQHPEPKILLFNAMKNKQTSTCNLQVPSVVNFRSVPAIEGGKNQRTPACNPQTQHAVKLRSKAAISPNVPDWKIKNKPTALKPKNGKCCKCAPCRSQSPETRLYAGIKKETDAKLQLSTTKCCKLVPRSSQGPETRLCKSIMNKWTPPCNCQAPNVARWRRAAAKSPKLPYLKESGASGRQRATLKCQMLQLGAAASSPQLVY